MNQLSAGRETPPDMQHVLDLIADGAAARDAAGLFPADAFELLRASGVLAWGAHSGTSRPPAADELALVRTVAAADGSVGRILDGHLNAVERLCVHAPRELREHELTLVRAGRLLAGVWGGDPRAATGAGPGEGEGEPATVCEVAGEEVLRGAKTFCSGAGGVDRALVLARLPEGGPPVAAWVDLTDGDRVEVDTTWFGGAGMRASVSHRVVFHDAPVLGRLGPPGSLATQPWFARDALRTSASWAGMADAAAGAALRELAGSPRRGQLEELAAGRIAAAIATIDAWLAHAARAMDAPDATIGQIALFGRVAVADACREVLDQAARACGSHPFAVGGTLDRARRELELFLLQHRLDPMLARAGAETLDGLRTQ